MIRIISADSATDTTLNMVNIPFGNVLSCKVKWGLSLFYDKPQSFNLDLACVCCALCCASYDESAIYTAVKKLGFDKAVFKNYSTATEICAFTMGYQKTAHGALAICVIKGTGHGQWQSNFELGDGDYHHGFEQSAEEISKSLSQFLKENKADKKLCKILICGHSRGAAVANIIAAKYSALYGSDKIYCYTFACPNVVNKDKTGGSFYNGIFNLVNRFDFIPSCPLSKWGYGRFGVTVDLLSKGAVNDRPDLPEKTKSAFCVLTKGGKLNIFDGFDITAEEFIENVYSLAKTRQEYYRKSFVVQKEKISLYDYFTAVCDVLESDSSSLDRLLYFMATLKTKLAPLTRFLMQGIDKKNIQNPIMSAHCCETYLSILLAYSQ